MRGRAAPGRGVLAGNMDILLFLAQATTGAPVPPDATGFGTWDLVALVAAVFLVVLNGFFVAAEFALVKVRPTRLDELAEQGFRSALKAQHAVRHLDAYLSATQLGITLASLGLGWLGEPAFGRLVAPLIRDLGLPPGAVRPAEVAIAFTVITFLHIVFGELAPKSLAIQRAQGVALAVAWPMMLFYSLFKIPIVILNGAALFILRLIGVQPAHSLEMAHSPEEIGMIIRSSEESGAVSPDEAELVRNAIIIGDRDARDVMVPRVDVVYLSTAWSLEENMRKVHEMGFTRYPLCDPDVDHVIGMIHLRDVLTLAQTPDADITQVRRDLLVVPETKPLDDLLREFQRRRIHMALVLDEYGGTAGIVTLEDVLEEIVGDIQDEHQNENPEIQRVGDQAFLVDGGVTLSELRRDLDIELEAEEADTVAGYVQWLLGSVPEVGQEVAGDGYLLRVESMEGRRVRSVLIRRARYTAAEA